MNIRRSLACLGTLAIAFAGVACAGASPDGTEQGAAARADGLTILEADAASGKLVAVFRKDGHEITYDMRLGPKMEVPNDSADPETPSYEIDAQILDEAGQPFYIQTGGDSFIDKTWHMPKEVKGFDEARRVADFGLARDAEQAWRGATLPTALAELRLAGMDIAKGLRNATDMKGKTTTPTVPAAPAEPTTDSPSLAPKVDSYYDSSVNIWDYQRWKKPTLGDIFEHSAVTLRGWTSGYSLVFQRNSCNHGACAQSTAMTSYCNYSGWLKDDGTHSRWFESETGTNIITYSGGCNTPYGISLGDHVCNDDTILEIKAITTDDYQGKVFSTMCATYPSLYAPSCG
ncbi:MAG: hypothetical protein ACXWP4_11690 [Polyangiales bacterium]